MTPWEQPEHEARKHSNCRTSLDPGAWNSLEPNLESDLESMTWDLEPILEA